MNVTKKLEEQSRDELINTVRKVLIESEALSSRIVAVSEIGIAINSTLDIDEIFNVVKVQAKWLLDFVHCSICLRDDNDQWKLNVLIGDKKHVQLTHDEIVTSEIGDSIRYGQSQLLKDNTETEFLPHVPAKIIIPLSSEDETIGTLNFACHRQYTHEDMRIAYLLALQLASAIRNARRMTLLHETQAQIERYAKELEAQNEDLYAYSHTIAHDLKSPLSVIPMKASLVKMYASFLPPQAIKHLNDITERTKHMAEMIDQLLMLSKIRDAEEILHCVNINQTIERALLRFPEIELGQVEMHIMPNLPSVMGHAQWIEEIFANLVSNSIKYRGDDNPQPTIKIYAEPDENDVNKVKFFVEDNGIGIRPEDQETLFQKFTRVHEVHADGLGLGLSIVNRIITKLEGDLGLYSTWGEGTTFWFSLFVSCSKSL